MRQPMGKRAISLPPGPPSPALNREENVQGEVSVQRARE